MNTIIKKILFCVGLIALIGGSYYGLSYIKKSRINDGLVCYNDLRDRPFIKQLFKDNWYLLTADPNSDVDFVFGTLSPNTHEAKYFGKMDITMMFENNVPAGVVTYYMLTKALGRVVYLAVDEKFRGKGYGEKLLRYACDQLKAKGALSVKLFVRSENARARKLYEKVGFEPAESEPLSVGLWYRKKL